MLIIQVTHISIYMKKALTALLSAMLAICVSAQDNMEGFKHLSLGVEAGLHGLGVELATPINSHFVLKAGYNFVPSGDLLHTNVKLDTKELRAAQEQYTEVTGYTFRNQFMDETIIDAGLAFGLHNYKAMINWHPFLSGRFYLAGGVYYTPKSHQDEPFIRLSGKTTKEDWAALKELQNQTGDYSYKLELEMGDESYPVIEKDRCGYVQSDFKFAPLKYYLGMGIGRCIPNRFLGLQLEVGAMIYHNSVMLCQDKEVASVIDAAHELENDAKEILEYIDKYPIYPQLSMRFSFGLF